MSYCSKPSPIRRYSFSQGYSLYFFLISAHLWFGVLRLGSWIVFGVFSWWALGPVVAGLLGLLGLGLSIKTKKNNPGKETLPIRHVHVYQLIWPLKSFCQALTSGVNGKFYVPIHLSASMRQTHITSRPALRHSWLWLSMLLYRMVQNSGVTLSWP